MDPYLQQTWDLGVKIVNVASAYATPYGNACSQVADAACLKLTDPSQRTPLSSKAQTFVPTSNNKICSAGWFNIAPGYWFEQLSSLAGTENVAPHGVVRSNSRDLAENKEVNSEKPLERATTTRGRQLERDHCEIQVPGVWNLPARMPSRTPSPDSSIYSQRSLDSHVNQLPVKNTFIHYDDTSSGDDEDVESNLDAETQSGTGLKRSASAPGLLMQNPVFELMSREEEDEEEDETEKKIVRASWSDSTELEMQRPLSSRPSYEMLMAHASGTCSPCAYFYQKEDSCRLGGECKFCHICPPDAIKKHKKMKLKARRREAARRQYSSYGVTFWENGCHYNNKLK